MKPFRIGAGAGYAGDRIDPRVGLSGLLPIGRRVDLGEQFPGLLHQLGGQSFDVV